MKKFINEPQNFVDEMLEGIYLAHPDQLRFVDDDRRCLVGTSSNKGKVGLATGGGSGHMPLFLGYVGEGMLDGCAVGGVFQSPSAQQIFNVACAVNSGSGVLHIFGNYGGDCMNFEMAKEMAAVERLRVEQVIAADDIASAPKEEANKRRGVAGIFFLYKCAGAAARAMADLDTVKRIADKAASNVRTMGVALSANVIPEVGRAKFELGENEIEIGMGIHGEPGIHRGPMKQADLIARELMESILSDLIILPGEEVAVLVNGLGATPKEELYIIYRKISRILTEKRISVFHAYIGEFATSLEMAGASVSILRLDPELKTLLARPARTPFFEQVQL